MTEVMCIRPVGQPALEVSPAVLNYAKYIHLPGAIFENAGFMNRRTSINMAAARAILVQTS